MSPTPARPLTSPMTAELRCITKHGVCRELDAYSDGPLAYYAQSRVLDALLQRNLIVPDALDKFVLTEAGRAALSVQETRNA